MWKPRCDEPRQRRTLKRHLVSTRPANAGARSRMLTPASSERVACERHESHAHHEGARRVEDGQCDVDWQEVRVAKEDRGFASMDRAKQREIASKGGKAAHQKGQ